MTDQELIDQMLALGGVEPQVPSADPVPPVTNAGSPEAQPLAPGSGAATEGTPAATAEPTPQPDPAAVPPTAQATAPAPKPEAVNLEDTFDKSNKAFAEMRTENQRLNNLLLRYGAFAKLDTKDPKAVEQLLNQIITAEEAKAKNVDPVILRTLMTQEEKLATYESEEIRKEANQSFMELQKQFNLDGKELNAFAKQLSAEGINPFATRGVNLTQHYLQLNWQKMLERAEERGVAKEAERQKRVAQASVPNGAVGDGVGGSAPGAQQPLGDGLEAFAKALGIR